VLLKKRQDTPNPMTVNSSHTYITGIITLFFFFSGEEKTIKIAKNVTARAQDADTSRILYFVIGAVQYFIH
jgi:hypothetical protein